jgi:hypothetical protein
MYNNVYDETRKRKLRELKEFREDNVEVDLRKDLLRTLPLGAKIDGLYIRKRSSGEDEKETKNKNNI